jgi:choline kinase
MKAVILAAGESKRLRPLTEKIPKCLIKIREKNLLEHTLENFQKFGIKEVIIVTGHGAKEVERQLTLKNYDMKIQCVFNPAYAEKNNIYSLWCLKNILPEGFILINSDVFCVPLIIRKAIYSKKNDFIVVDDVKSLSEEEMKIKAENDLLKTISKDISPESADGEYIGIARFSSEGGALLGDVLDYFISIGETSLFYEAAFNRMASFYDISLLRIGGLSWIEIDDFEDLEEAREVLFEKIIKGKNIETLHKDR